MQGGSTGALQIVSDKAGLLIAEQPNPHIGVSTVQGFIVPLLLVLAFFLYKANRKVWLILPAVGLIAVWGIKSPEETAQMTIDRPHGSIEWRTYTAKKQLGVHEVQASDLVTANVQAVGPNGRLLLVGKDGTQLLPLGENYTPDASVQYILAHEIQNLIDRRTPNPDGQEQHEP